MLLQAGIRGTYSCLRRLSYSTTKCTAPTEPIRCLSESMYATTECLNSRTSCSGINMICSSSQLLYAVLTVSPFTMHAFCLPLPASPLVTTLWWSFHDFTLTDRPFLIVGIRCHTAHNFISPIDLQQKSRQYFDITLFILTSERLRLNLTLSLYS